MYSFFKKKSGFTLIELLIALGIIVILSATLIVAINPPLQFKMARDNQRKTHVIVIHGAFSEYKAREGEFPPCLLGETPVEDCEAYLVPDYLESIPEDPNDDCSGSGYLVKESPAQRIGVKAECAEEEEITVGDWKD